MSFTQFAAKPIEEIFLKLKTSENGLSQDEAKVRAKKYGLNKTPEKETYWWQIL